MGEPYGRNPCVFNILAFRAKVVCTSQQALYKEMEHIRKAQQTCNFQQWVVNTLEKRFTANTASTMDKHPLTTNLTTTTVDQTTTSP